MHAMIATVVRATREVFSALCLEESSLRAETDGLSVARFDAAGDEGRSRAWRSGQTAARLSAQAERKRSPVPRRGHRTCNGAEERATLAGTFDTVVVAGQTRVHAITVRRAACRHRAINRATIVPQGMI